MITYRQAQLEDAPSIATVEVESKRASVPEVYSEGEMDQAWSLDRWTGYINGTRTPTHGLDDRIVYVASAGESIVGFAACHHTTKRGIDAELQSIYVLLEHQRRGIGLELIRLIVEWAMSGGRSSLLAGFYGSNPYVAFYQKLDGYLDEGPCIWRDLQELSKRIEAEQARARQRLPRCAIKKAK